MIEQVTRAVTGMRLTRPLFIELGKAQAHLSILAAAGSAGTSSRFKSKLNAAPPSPLDTKCSMSQGQTESEGMVHVACTHTLSHTDVHSLW
jgi:hypothetical protein